MGMFSGAVGGIIGSLIFKSIAPDPLKLLPAWLSAIGTISAVSLSLYLMLQQKTMGVEVYSGPIDVRDWDYPTYDVTENIICINPDDSNYVFSIVSVRLSFWINNQKSVRKIKISDVDVENSNTGKLILESGNSKTVATIDWTMLNEKYAKKIGDFLMSMQKL